jgi:hypothetical protein
MDQLLDNPFIDSLMDTSALLDNKKLWISSLQKIVNQEIPLVLTLDEFKHFFKKKMTHLIISIRPTHGPLQNNP